MATGDAPPLASWARPPNLQRPATDAASAGVVAGPAKPISRVVRTAKPSDCRAALPLPAPGAWLPENNSDLRVKDGLAWSDCNLGPLAPAVRRGASRWHPYLRSRARSAVPHRCSSGACVATPHTV